MNRTVNGLKFAKAKLGIFIHVIDWAGMTVKELILKALVIVEQYKMRRLSDR